MRLLSSQAGGGEGREAGYVSTKTSLAVNLLQLSRDHRLSLCRLASMKGRSCCSFLGSSWIPMLHSYSLRSGLGREVLECCCPVLDIVGFLSLDYLSIEEESSKTSREMCSSVCHGGSGSSELFLRQSLKWTWALYRPWDLQPVLDLLFLVSLRSKLDACESLRGWLVTVPRTLRVCICICIL